MPFTASDDDKSTKDKDKGQEKGQNKDKSQSKDKGSEKATPSLVVGQPVECLVQEVNMSARSATLRMHRTAVVKATVTSTILPFNALTPGYPQQQHQHQPLLFLSSNSRSMTSLNLTTLPPFLSSSSSSFSLMSGMKMQVKVESVIQNGLKVQFLDQFFGVVDSSSLPQPMTEKETRAFFPQGSGDTVRQTHEARIVFIDHGRCVCGHSHLSFSHSLYSLILPPS